jgi:hypothetical protein
VIQITHFDFGPISFPNNLISLELSQHCHPVDVVNSCVEGLMLLFKATGQINRIVGKGEQSQVAMLGYR